MSSYNQSDLKWLMFKKEEDKFPFWLFIEREKGKFIFLKAKEKWPGPGKNIFCKFEGEVKKRNLPKEKPIDSCKIFSLRQYGKKLDIVLDRNRNKRCWFIFLKKEYKQKPGLFYYQVFWITQASIIRERKGVYIPYSLKEDYKILIDSNERYPYKFGKTQTERQRLKVGDYALLVDNKIIAIAERKTKDNFFHEIPTLDVLRLKLEEMEKFPYKVVLFESDYTDLTSEKNKFFKPGFVAEVLGDLFAQFPNIQFIFFKGRKSANKWLAYYFKRIYKRYVSEKENKKYSFGD